MSASYEFHIELNKDFDTALAFVKEAAMAEKLGVVSEVDISAIMKAKLDKDIEPYRLLGLCAPPLALRVIEGDPNAGVLLPCNVVVRGAGSKTVVSFMDPGTVLGLAGNAAADAVAADAQVVLDKVVARLKG
ncbi:MAG: DUF302 domain-containing protein [Chromatiales bacterium]|nr:DUF302 domain-containing protein [Chromatiales bacterium]